MLRASVPRAREREHRKPERLRVEAEEERPPPLVAHVVAVVEERLRLQRDPKT